MRDYRKSTVQHPKWLIDGRLWAISTALHYGPIWKPKKKMFDSTANECDDAYLKYNSKVLHAQWCVFLPWRNAIDADGQRWSEYIFKRRVCYTYNVSNSVDLLGVGIERNLMWSIYMNICLNVVSLASEPIHAYVVWYRNGEREGNLVVIGERASTDIPTALSNRIEDDHSFSRKISKVKKNK